MKTSQIFPPNYKSKRPSSVPVYIYIYIFDKNFNNRYFITLEVTLIHTVDIEDNKYYLNNIMEKVIPKSKTKFLQNFF